MAFCRRLKGKRLDKAVVRSSQGSWHIKVGKCRKGLLYFEQGWEDFVTHHDLDLGDFVVFEHKGDMVFDAIVFDSSSCEKEFPVSINFSEKSRKEIDNLSDEFESYSHTTEEGNFKGTTTRINFNLSIHVPNCLLFVHRAIPVERCSILFSEGSLFHNNHNNI